MMAGRIEKTVAKTYQPQLGKRKKMADDRTPKN